MGPKRKWSWKAAGVMLLAVSMLMAACSHPSAQRADGLVTWAPPVPVQEYRIQPGDQLDIKFFYNPELNEQLTVRPDGRITLQLVNEMPAAGRTPAELTDQLSKAFAAELTNPKVAVIVRSSVADKIYVDGEVTRAGLVPLVGPMTILQAIAQAGGMRETATDEVILLRKTEDNKMSAFRVSLPEVMNGAGGQDIYLKPNDIVYVPKSAIANVNTWVDQYLRRNIPLAIGLSL